MITKYNGPEWNTKPTAIRLVEVLVEHRTAVQIELNEVTSGVRKLKDTDFLGPKEGPKRRVANKDDKKDDFNYAHYLNAMGQHRFNKKRHLFKEASNREGIRKREVNGHTDEIEADAEFSEVRLNSVKQRGEARRQSKRED